MNQFLGIQKAVLVECIMDKHQLNLGTIITPKILMRVGKEHTSSPFSMLITALCHRMSVPFDKKTDIENTLSSFMTSNLLRLNANGWIRKRKIKYPLIHL